MESISQTTATPHRNARRSSDVPQNCIPPILDDINKKLDNSCSRKTNVSRPRSTRPPRDVTSTVRAKSTQRRRLPEDGEKLLKLTRPKSLVRSRTADNDHHSSMSRSKDVKTDARRHVATDDESSKRTIRPISARRNRSAQDESSSPLRRMKPSGSSEQRVRPDHDESMVRRTRPKSVQRDQLLDDSPIATGPKRKESIHQSQQPRNDANADNSNAPSNRNTTKSRTTEATPEKQRRHSTIIPKSTGTDRRRRCSTSDVLLNTDRRKSEIKVTRSSDASKTHDSNPNESNDLRRHSRTPGKRGENDDRHHRRTPGKRGDNDDTEKPRRGEIRKHKSSPDIDQLETSDIEGGNAALSKSKSVRNNSTIKNVPEREELPVLPVVRRNLVRKPSMQVHESRTLEDIGNSSSHSSTVSAAVIQFDPTQQSGVAIITQDEVVQHQEKSISRTLVRKPSQQIAADDNDDFERPSESNEQPSGRGLVRKPSMMNHVNESNDDDDDDDGSIDSHNSSSASTVIQFDPTQQNGVSHVDPNDIDDCISIAIFGESASIIASEMENSWAAPILAFHDSDGEELDEKPVSRRHNSSTKLLHSLQRRPSCGDSVHTKSSESHTTSSSFGRPQYYAPPPRNSTNAAASLTASFAEFIEKDQSIDELNSDNLPLKSKTKKKKLQGDKKIDADDEKSLVGHRTKVSRPKLKKEVSTDRKKASFEDVPVLRQMLSTSHHSAHSLLASDPDSDDDSFDDDRRMSDVFKPTPLNNIVSNSNVNMTAYESETENVVSSSKKGKGGRIGKYFFGGNNNSSTHSRQMRPKRDTTVEESEASDSEYSCSSVRSNSSRRSGVFGAATRRLMKSSSNRHALLGDGDVENDVVPFSW